MSRLSFTEALDLALELLEQGHTLEDAVQQFPEYADELRPLLQITENLQQMAHEPMPAFDRVAATINWEQLLSDVPQQLSFTEALDQALELLE